MDPATSEIQHLGHLLEQAGAEAVVRELEAELATRRVGWVRLVHRHPSCAICIMMR